MDYLTDKTKEELIGWMEQNREPSFRGTQVFQWIQRGAHSWDSMVNIPKNIKEKMKKDFSLQSMGIEKIQESRKDFTKKYLLKTHDGQYVESVRMKYDYGNTLCISSQIGCRMGCTFCASTLEGKVRNLTAGEMMEQILLIQKNLQEKVGRVVIMGMGEPLDNYEELKRFLTIIHDKDGMNISWRNLTVSTCGVIPGMKRLAEDFPQVNLAISLHRTEDKGRSRLMPVNRKYPLEELLKVAREHGEKTKRRVTFEYVLIKGENDGDDHLNQLIEKLKPIHCHVNLIPLNPVEETGLSPGTISMARRFARSLEQKGIPATIRRELGKDIDGACGQLRRREKT